ncbi:MAG: Tex-like N-terminal domain-containing protein [Pirellulaceae bacterium]
MIDDLSVIARDFKLPLTSVTAAVRLLDEGNAIPFVARFRKDLTGGLDAEQIQAIKQRIGELRALSERKSFVLKSIESQGKLTDELKSEIEKATNNRRVEDLYLPFKAKKQSLALTARQQGLEPLANQIFNGEQADVALTDRATEFVRVDKGLGGVDDVITGVGYLIAERLSERSELRRELRKIIWSSAQFTCKLVQTATEENESSETDESSVSDNSTADNSAAENSTGPDTGDVEVEKAAEVNTPAATTDTPELSKAADAGGQASDSSSSEGQIQSTANALNSEDSEANPALVPEVAAIEESTSETVANSEASHLSRAGVPMLPAGVTELPAPDSADSSAATPEASPDSADKKKRKKKRKKKKAAPHPFADYENFSETIKKIPHHRVLAINRGERSGQLKVKLKVDNEKIVEIALKLLVPEEHPFKSFVEDCARDALTRMVLPSLEREVRRELTDAAERHAVKVFAHNLKGLLLRPPVRGERVLAIDPGYKNGCTIAVVEPNGNLVASDKVSVVGNDQRKETNRKRLAEIIREHQANVIAIGNGTACREVEKLVSDAIANELADLPVKYIIVNEAGASIYSTSEIGKEELPDVQANVRSAVSIGRRLLDPLSELVKIAPGNLGVGLYQHDIKAKHLAESLDEVVESCVNYVGVNTASASPALLGYVAGLNQLTARRLIEHRQENPIKNRNDLKEIPGIGDATFVQSAGFLRVYGGDQPFDETAIHPESYAVAEQVLNKIGVDAATWHQSRHASSTGEGSEDSQSQTVVQKLSGLNIDDLAKEFGVGEMMMHDIVETLKRPAHDPRFDGDRPVFRSGIIKIEDLQPEMELQSQIINVVDFGVFVDVGLGYSCLVHVSELSPGFIKDLYESFAVGDSLITWVKEVDVPRRRVKLTAVKPGTPKQDRRGPRRDASDVNSSGRPARNEARSERRGPPKGRHGGKPVGKHSGKPSHFKKKRHERTGKPKPVVPITKEMLTGDKPMRSFSDLAQFYSKKKDDE